MAHGMPVTEEQLTDFPGDLGEALAIFAVKDRC